MGEIAVVTGAFSNIGRAVAGALLERGWTVRTLTNRQAAPDDPPIESFPLRFERDHLARAVQGAHALVNTYWVRMREHGASFEDAVANSRLLIDVALASGVNRIVQVSVSNASPSSTLGYYRGKALVEEHVRSRAPSWAIVRPTLVVGPRDVLTGNIAWFVRRLPVVMVPWGGEYPLQPVTLADVAGLVADRVESDVRGIVDAAGAERYTFREYVGLVAEAVGRRVRIVAGPPSAMLMLLGLVGRALGDVVLTHEELAGLRDGNLVSAYPPTGGHSVRAWLLANGPQLGRRYTNDIAARRAGR